ncbi:TPA: hypothetical protein MFC68_001634 [Klebsiella pneumoniae]|uniref:hypothetical protein n=1 Tax=Klebsiella pneumoniae complex TaxID=3390273 RepID=UPI0007CBAA17|nr:MULTISPECIES: hypothetical protein [Klebsiella]HBY0413321.1 hypothetical protein [Klebsiella pneumoniae subsp. pneumoniae]ELA1010866.1 hypothetical protein [Klebsiella pneumoniae]MCB3742348.1 hypothetical protein [Klebsiella pneumoniae]MCM6290662.1 hypothetical protein [Klebsiella pneumoniae]QRR72471.1 hypothetical protein I6K54_20165 [Klebsiella pneumoniae]
MTSKLTIESPEQRLKRVLTENAGKFSIDEDGGIHTNWQHPEVQATMRRHFEALSKIKVVRK